MEPQGLHDLGDGFAVLGSPTFEWLRSPTGERTRTSQDSFMGALFDERGRVSETITPPPEVGHFDWVVSAPLDEAVAVLLPEVSEPFPARDALIRMVYGERRRGEWSAVETLPVPPGSLLYSSASRLVPTEEGLLWVVPHERRVLLYERRDGAWTHRSIAERLVDRAVLHRSPAYGTWVGFAGVDPMYGDHRVTLRLHRLDRAAPSIEVDGLPGGGRIRRPRLADGSDGLGVGWIVETADGTSAWAAAGVRPGFRHTPVFLHDAARDIVPVRLFGDDVVFVADHVDPITSLAELRFYRVEGRRLRPIGSITNPYVTFFDALAVSANDILLLGPEYDPGSISPFVRSLVLRLSISCS